MRKIVLANSDYIQESAVYLKSETHGGEDVSYVMLAIVKMKVSFNLRKLKVPVYASGPMSYIFGSTIEQKY
jgi:hypothetical protein